MLQFGIAAGPHVIQQLASGQACLAQKEKMDDNRLSGAGTDPKSRLNSLPINN